MSPRLGALWLSVFFVSFSGLTSATPASKSASSASTLEAPIFNATNGIVEPVLAFPFTTIKEDRPIPSPSVRFPIRPTSSVGWSNASFSSLQPASSDIVVETASTTLLPRRKGLNHTSVYGTAPGASGTGTPVPATNVLPSATETEVIRPVDSLGVYVTEHPHLTFIPWTSAPYTTLTASAIHGANETAGPVTPSASNRTMLGSVYSTGMPSARPQRPTETPRWSNSTTQRNPSSRPSWNSSSPLSSAWSSGSPSLTWHESNTTFGIPRTANGSVYKAWASSVPVSIPCTIVKPTIVTLIDSETTGTANSSSISLSEITVSTDTIVSRSIVPTKVTLTGYDIRETPTPSPSPARVHKSRVFTRLHLPKPSHKSRLFTRIHVDTLLPSSSIESLEETVAYLTSTQKLTFSESASSQPTDQSKPIEKTPSPKPEVRRPETSKAMHTSRTQKPKIPEIATSKLGEQPNPTEWPQVLEPKIKRPNTSKAMPSQIVKQTVTYLDRQKSEVVTMVYLTRSTTVFAQAAPQIKTVELAVDRPSTKTVTQVDRETNTLESVVTLIKSTTLTAEAPPVTTTWEVTSTVLITPTSAESTSSNSSSSSSSSSTSTWTPSSRTTRRYRPTYLAHKKSSAAVSVKAPLFGMVATVVAIVFVFSI